MSIASRAMAVAYPDCSPRIAITVASLTLVVAYRRTAWVLPHATDEIEVPYEPANFASRAKTSLSARALSAGVAAGFSPPIGGLKAAATQSRIPNTSGHSSQ